MQGWDGESLSLYAMWYSVCLLSAVHFHCERAENTRSLLCRCFKTGKKKIRLPVSQHCAIMFGHAAGSLRLDSVKLVAFIVQEPCESRGGRLGLSVLTNLLVSVDVKLY